MLVYNCTWGKNNYRFFAGMKYLKNLPVMITVLITFTNSHAQTANFAAWLATFHTYKINEKFDIVFDGHLRSTKQVKHISTILLRPGISYKFSKHVSVALGYALNDARREVGGLNRLIPEHRVWQHVILRHKISSASLMHRFRLEQRFLPKVIAQNNLLVHNGYNWANRFRYFTRTVIPFKKGNQFCARSVRRHPE